MEILLADDDGSSQQIMASQLKKLGHEAILTADGGEAWEAFQTRKPKLVITDWMMPRVDGLELCRRIRNFERPEYTYLIILTALDRKVGFLEGMNAGADDFVTKPCDVVELSVRLRVAQRILSLQTEVQQLEGLLPICPKCKRIQDGEKGWVAVESYIMKKTDAQFSHGICPECYKTIMVPQLEEMKRRRA